MLSLSGGPPLQLPPFAQLFLQEQLAMQSNDSSFTRARETYQTILPGIVGTFFFMLPAYFPST
jgi:hypothetical protein